MFLLGSGGFLWKVKDIADDKAKAEINACQILNEAKITEVKTKCSYEKDSLRVSYMELALSCGHLKMLERFNRHDIYQEGWCGGGEFGRRKEVKRD